jgi:molecular chaperone IbpA
MLLKEDMDHEKRFRFSPYRRSTVGFDRLFDYLENDSRAEQDNYPPFDIEKLADDQYRITLAVAGFKRTRSTSPRGRTCW